MWRSSNIFFASLPLAALPQTGLETSINGFVFIMDSQKDDLGDMNAPVNVLMFKANFSVDR
jgi:hypothetical protein